MYFERMRWMLAAGMYLAAAMGSGSGQAERSDLAYRRGYYLFLAGTPNGCEDCYIPLLITRKRLEELKVSATADDAVLITTYERDSVWHYDGILQISQGDINAAERKIRLFAKSYRYQEIDSKEILRLLENPLGKIPISRIALPTKLPVGPELQQLITDFRAVK